MNEKYNHHMRYHATYVKEVQELYDCEFCLKNNEGLKHDADKLRYDLMPPKPLEEIVQVLTEGCKEYGERNWELGLDWGRVYAATMRHLQDWRKGVDIDKKSGLKHLAHSACNLIFLLEFSETKKELDDRKKKITNTI